MVKSKMATSVNARRSPADNLATAIDARGLAKATTTKVPPQLVAVPKFPDLRPSTQNLSDTPDTQSKTLSPTTTLGRQQDATTEKKEKKDIEAVKYGNEEKERIRREYDVYAEPFIPAALRAVNEEPANVVKTESKHKIDSVAYLATYLGTGFISKPTNIHNHHENQKILPTGVMLTENSYLQYFQSLLKIESAAKQEEYKKYSLYQIPVYYITNPSLPDQLYLLSVPGLREDSPRLEMGDFLQLRQLWTDAFGNPLLLPTHVSSQQFHGSVLHQYWGGVQYNASIYSIDRAKEIVYLKIIGFAPPYLNRPYTFNVVFPLKQKDIDAQWGALGLIAGELKKAYPMGTSTRTAHEELSKRAANIIALAPPSTHRANGGHSDPPNEWRAPNDWIRRMLFPTEADGIMQTKLRTIPSRRGLFDHNLNYEQLQSVNSVCENEYGCLPFLISGPPGTGKTKTLVELALNLLNSTSIGHILVCAPSESAADTLAQRLKVRLKPKQLFRLNAPSRADNEVPQDLLPYCYMENEMFYLPPFAQLMAYNVVVTSTRDAAILASVNVTNSDLFTAEVNMQRAFHPEAPPTQPKLHWGALLLDEAAQATEIDALPALSVVMPPSDYPNSHPQPRFAMAGDQNQLGPRTASLNEQYSTSLFERLFSRPLYAQHPLSRNSVRPSDAPPVMTKKMLPMLYPPFANLIRNYRSHPAILAVPSQLFYNDTLIPQSTIPPSLLPNSSLWRGRHWPVLFTAHTGLDEIERDGGGWYNVSEARLACNLAARLVYESGVKQKEICIMSPFAAQVRVLRNLMRSNLFNNGAGMWGVNIGPLEAFQGLESRVVIICTTRTRSRFVDIDVQRGLGIVRQKRKMNVALTRAKEALFVIGSPEVLGQDPHWRAFLSFCWRNGLVDKGGALWDGGQGDEGRIGVLERALLVQEERRQEVQQEGRVLGAANIPRGLEEEDAWIQGLRAALEEYNENNDDDHDEAEDEEDNAHFHHVPSEEESEPIDALASDSSSVNGA